MHQTIGILLSGSGTTYENLHHHIEAGVLPARIAVVISSRIDVAGVDRARRFGHPLVIAKDPEQVTEALRSHGAQWVVMCGWLRFWDPPAPWQGKTVNIHPALLPAYGGKGMHGAHVHRAVLAAGETRSGCTVHQVDGAYDSGPIIAQQEVPVHADDTPATLATRVQAAERDLYPRVLAEMLQQQ